MSDDPRLPYTVQGHYRTGVRTYLCPTPEWALRKLADFDKSGCTNITVTGPEGLLTEAELKRLIREPTPIETGAPIDLDAPSAPAMAA